MGSNLSMGRFPVVNGPEKAMSRQDYKRLKSVAEAVTGYYYLGQAYEAAGRKQDAVTQCETFLSIWKNADSELKQIQDAKVRLARLKT
jgi:hypothetical protein